MRGGSLTPHDAKYGARHLKRAIDRILVQPLSNLIASGQINSGDSIRVDFGSALGHFSFYREAGKLPTEVIAPVVAPAIPVEAPKLSQGAGVGMPRAVRARLGRH